MLSVSPSSIPGGFVASNSHHHRRSDFAGGFPCQIIDELCPLQDLLSFEHPVPVPIVEKLPYPPQSISSGHLFPFIESSGHLFPHKTP